MNFLSDDFEYKFKHRTIQYGNVTFNLHIVNTLPFVVGSDGWINKTKITIDYSKFNQSIFNQSDFNANPSQKVISLDSTHPDPKIKQEIKEKRYQFITSVMSVISLTSVYLYYDNVYQDIIILPDLESFITTKDNLVINLSIYRIGSKGPLNERAVHSQLGLDANDIFPLPNVNPTNATNIIITIPGANSPIKPEQFLMESFSGIRKPYGYSFISLGKCSTVFSTDTNLPLYMLGNFKYGELGLQYLGVTALPNNNLYIPLNF